MDLSKVYNEFINNYPQYAKNLHGYEELPGEGLKLLFNDGRAAIYYPIEHIVKPIHPDSIKKKYKNAKNK